MGSLYGEDFVSDPCIAVIFMQHPKKVLKPCFMTDELFRKWDVEPSRMFFVKRLIIFDWAAVKEFRLDMNIADRIFKQ